MLVSWRLSECWRCAYKPPPVGVKSACMSGESSWFQALITQRK
jgi:hypothetical protein